MDKAKHDIEEYLKKKGLTAIFEVPKNPEFGDFAMPCFTFSKELKKNPMELAKELADELSKQFPNLKITPIGPYVNFLMNRAELAKNIVEKILKEKEEFGKKQNNNKTIVIDYSAPNIAKPFGIGHLRSTVIGSSLYKIYTHLGYKVIGVNHLGDWGTQYGKLNYAFKMWGNEEDLNKDPIKYLLELYVRFHKEAKENPELEEKGREWSKKLEDGDEESLALWKKFVALSLKEFQKTYDDLNVKFDYNQGESFYVKMADSLADKLKEKNLLEESDGALIVNLEKYGMPPCLIRRSDGATLYATRDLATLFYRIEKFNPEKILYVVGEEQALHFQQFFKVAELYDPKLAGRGVHVIFGRYRFADGKMSTREGKLVLMDDVLAKSVELCEKIILEKNPTLENKKEVAKQVGIGAVVFADLSTDRVKGVVFDWDKILSFEGETGPYIQYSYVRINSIIEKNLSARKEQVDFSLLTADEEKNLAKKLSEFESVVEKAGEEYKPSNITRYLLDLAARFNEFYHACPVLNAENEELKSARIALIESTRIVLKIGLNLLGIDAPRKM